MNKLSRKESIHIIEQWVNIARNHIIKSLNMNNWFETCSKSSEDKEFNQQIMNIIQNQFGLKPSEWVYISSSHRSNGKVHNENSKELVEEALQYYPEQLKISIRKLIRNLQTIGFDQPF